MSNVDLEEVFVRVCLDAQASSEDLSRLSGQEAHWMIYRDMVRSRFQTLFVRALPRSSRVVGTDVWERLTTRFLAEHRPRTRIFRDLVHEFVGFVQNGSALPAGLAPYWLDLLRYEACRWRVAAKTWPRASVDAFDFHRKPVFNPTLELLEVNYRVDRSEEMAQSLAATHTLIVFRKPNSDKIQTWVLTPFGRALVDAWYSEVDCVAASKCVLTSMDEAEHAAFIDRMTDVLSALLDEEVIVGSRVSGV